MNGRGKKASFISWPDTQKHDPRPPFWATPLFVAGTLFSRRGELVVAASSDF